MRSSSTRYLGIAAVFCLVLLFGQSSPTLIATEEDKQLYLAHNMWTERKRIWSVNYKRGLMLRAGSPINNVVPRRSGIRFTHVDSGITYTIVFRANQHPNRTLSDIRDRMITDQSFEEITAGFTELEIDGVNNGAAIEGMSKRAVLVALGHPPEIYTPSTRRKEWRYRRSKRDTFIIYFDDMEKVSGFKD